MSGRAFFLPPAEDDIAAAFSYYEHQRIGLGDEFETALRDVVKRIEENPEWYGVFRRDIRAAPLK